MTDLAKRAQWPAASLMLVMLIACGPATNSNPPSQSETKSSPPAPEQNLTCDCSIFPPKQGCDSECGIATGVVEQVRGDSVVIRVPSIKVDASGKGTPEIKERTFSVTPSEAAQLKKFAPGTRVALTFGTSNNTMKTIRKLPPA